MADLEAKVVLVGSQSVGKTCIVLRYVQGTFSGNTGTTIGAAFFTNRLIIGGKRLKLQIWDTAGQERFRSMAPMYYRNARAAILVYDVCNKSSLEDLATWAKDVRTTNGPSLLLAIVGNKMELREGNAGKCVSREEGEAFARSNNALYFETSAKENLGITELFLQLAEALISKELASPSSTAPETAGAAPSPGKCC